MELLERDALLAALDARLEAAAGGAGSLMLLAGEAGIGKTSLARAFCDRHSADAEVWWGACDALTTPRPLGALYDVARDAGGDLAAVMASEAGRHERFTALLDALVSPLRPVIAVIEDVHWADEATRDLLVFVARRVERCHTVIIATYRDDEVGSDHPLRVTLGTLATQQAVNRLSLSRLSETAVAALAADHLVDAAEVYRITSGNPFFVTELLATGEHDTVPRTVADTVLARAAGLSPEARAALHAAAIMPDHAPAALVRAIAAVDATATEECVRAGLLHADGRSVRFRHELARLAVERDIPATLLPDLHAAALAELESSGADPARLAYHADAAGDGDAVLRHAPVAAVKAARLGANREAAAHYRRALAYADVLPPPEQAELMEAYARVAYPTGERDEALAQLGRAVTVWREVGDIERAAWVMARRASLAWNTRPAEQAHSGVREALELLQHRPPSRELGYVYARAAQVRMSTRDGHGGVAYAQRALALAEQFDDQQLQKEALTILGVTQWFVEPDRAEATLVRAMDLARAAGDEAWVGNILISLGSGGGDIRRYRAAEPWLRECVTFAESHDFDFGRDYGRAWLARTAFEQGRWSEATDLLGEVAHSALFTVRVTADCVRGRLRVRRGDPDPHGPLDDVWQQVAWHGELQYLWPVAAARAEAAWLAGQPDRIPGMLGDVYQLALTRDQQWATGELAYWLWKSGAIDTAPEGAAEPYALQINGAWRKAAQEWEAIGCPYEAAMARAEGDDPDQLRTALDTFIRLGARPTADRVAARLRALGVRDLPRQPTRATAANPAGLTDRELEVLALLTDGATNHDIATRLHISPKTAGHHVSAILTKLDTPTRRDAARAARELGIT
jgi:DNA-binding CsgD family transcriptional regulator